MKIGNATTDTAPHDAATAQPQASDSRCFTVVSDKRTFGIPVGCIQTIFQIASVTPVPLAHSAIIGLVNLRGKIATAVSLRRRLNPHAPAETSRLAVGLDHRGESFALVVDEVGDVLMLDHGTQIDMPPHLGAEGLKISHVHRLEALILPILDLDWILAFGKD